MDPNRGFRKQEPPQQRKDDRLKEGLEAGGLIKCVCKILSEGLGIDPDGEFEIERAHRALAPRPSADQPTRIVLIKFLLSSAREKVLQAAKKRNDRTGGM